jgi:hypothetical protein
MTWDAVVIGAGPAGSVTARELARRGCRVLLVDKATFPRAKVCGCCLNGAAVGTLERLGLGHVLDGAVRLDRVTVAAGSRAADLRLPRGAALSRGVFDARLVEEAVKAGVEFRPGTPAKFGDVFLTSPGVGKAINEARLLSDLPPCGGGGERSEPVGGDAFPNPTPHPPLRGDLPHKGGGKETTAWRVEASGEQVVARVAILASGLTGGDAVPQPGSRIGAGVVLPAEVAPPFFAAGTIYMATGRCGYVGLVRVEDDRLDVAAAFDAGFAKAAGGLGPAAEVVLGGVGWPVPPGLADQPWKGTPALTRRPVRLAGRGLFVVGDAAGYVEPFTGEGMAWAVMSAAALGPIAARAVRSWDDSLVPEWEATHRRVVGRRQRVCRVVSRVLRSPTLTGIAVRALRLFPVLSRPVVAALNRPAPAPHGPPA